MSGENGKTKFNIDGSLIVVTGGSSGIGKETARKLSWNGASVLIASRDFAKADAAKKDIERETGNPVKALTLDLASLESIRSFSEKLIEFYGIPDVLINNAGIYSRKHMLSENGWEMSVAVNYFGTFYLSSLLLPHMLELPGESRIVNVVSDAYRAGRFYPDLGKSLKLKGFKAYALSKRAAMYYTFELAERLKDSNISVNCVHPGHSNTGIWPSDVWYWKLAQPIIAINADPPSYSAENVVFAASSPELSGVTGKYIADLEIREPRNKIFNKDEQKALWDYTLGEFERLGAL
jgi:NAD(P)-dependent dehydrogenase (short-subunit alcohol dehydrogenase family)